MISKFVLPLFFMSFQRMRHHSAGNQIFSNQNLTQILDSYVSNCCAISYHEKCARHHFFKSNNIFVRRCSTPKLRSHHSHRSAPLITIFVFGYYKLCLSQFLSHMFKSILHIKNTNSFDICSHKIYVIVPQLLCMPKHAHHQ